MTARLRDRSRRKGASGPGRRLVGALLLLVIGSAAVALAATDSLAGRVVDRDGRGLLGVRVTAAGQTAVTGADGRFRLRGLAPGRHRIRFEQAGRSAVREIEIPWQGEGELVQVVAWPALYQESLTVYAASKRRQRLVEAPAAVTSLLPRELEAQTSSGQLPRLLDFTPGVQISQSDLYDFNLNTRGFNSAINRRVLTLIDGRQTSVPEFLGVQEWGAMSMPLDEFETVELVRGPSSALYGAGAVSGVLNIVTKSARLTLFIAHGRGIFGGRPVLRPAHVGKWVVLRERWPELAQRLTREPDRLAALESAVANPRGFEAVLALLEVDTRSAEALREFCGKSPKNLGKVLRRLIHFQRLSAG